MAKCLVHNLRTAHEDTRRIISEVSDPLESFSVQQFHVKSSLPLGNHYHIIKSEVFVIITGDGLLIVKDIDDDNSREAIRLTAGSVVKIKPLTAHCFLMSPGTEMICFSSMPYDEADMIIHELV